MPSHNLRIQLQINNKFYYDIGLRKDNYQLSKTVMKFGEKQPRFLEDFIEKYGKNKIKILDYGKLIDDKKYIDNILK